MRRLTLTDFRCYAALRLEAPVGPVVLAGPNGAGKTNILEALSFLVPGRGLRRARLSEAARRDAGEGPDGPIRPWAVAATVDGPDGETDLGTGLAAPDAAKPTIACLRLSPQSKVLTPRSPCRQSATDSNPCVSAPLAVEPAGSLPQSECCWSVQSASAFCRC